MIAEVRARRSREYLIAAIQSSCPAEENCHEFFGPRSTRVDGDSSWKHSILRDVIGFYGQLLATRQNSPIGIKGTERIVLGLLSQLADVAGHFFDTRGATLDRP